MADVTAVPAQREDVLARPAELPAEAVPRPFPALPRPLVVLWAGLFVATVAFFMLGSLRIGAGNWIGRRMPVREIWSRFLGFLADQGMSAALVMAVTAAAGIALVAAGIALWLAFGLRDDRPQPTADESAGT